MHVNATSETELSVWWSLPVDTCGADIELTLCAEDPPPTVLPPPPRPPLPRSPPSAPPPLIDINCDGAEGSKSVYLKPETLEFIFELPKNAVNVHIEVTASEDLDILLQEEGVAPDVGTSPQLPNGRMNLKEGRSLGSYVNHANAAD